MNFYGDKPNIPDTLLPLFEAMKSGKRIKSVTCMAGSINANNPQQDFKIEDFVATDYLEGMGSDHEGNQFDYVDTDAPEDRTGRKALTKSFYMNWIKEFEL